MGEAKSAKLGTNCEILSAKEIEESVEGDTELTVEKAHEINAPHGLYSMLNGLLYMTEGPPGSNLRLCVPYSFVNEAIELVHSGIHSSIRKTFQSLSIRYYFPHMTKFVKAYVNRCGKCQTSKPSKEKTAGKLQPIQSPLIPTHTVSIDFIIGLPESSGYNTLMTIICKFSKAVKLIACRDTITTKDVACLYFC